MKIGFIGLGLMGAGFTKRLVATGHRVTGYDIDADKLPAARRWGGGPAASPAEAARTADLAAICVTTTHAVEEVALGENGLTSLGRLDGKSIVDFSTTEIAATHRVADGLREAGASFVDAPVSGGPGAAEAGTLAIMAGGEPA